MDSALVKAVQEAITLYLRREIAERDVRHLTQELDQKIMGLTDSQLRAYGALKALGPDEDEKIQKAEGGG